MAEKFHVYLVGGAVRDQLLNLLALFAISPPTSR